MIADTINTKIAEAMKARDETRLSTLRMLSSALSYEKINKRKDLSGEEEIAVVQKEAKKRKDAIEALRNARGKLTTSTEEQVDKNLKKEEEELKILQEYLPPEISEEDLEKEIDIAVTQLGATSIADMGKVIGMVKTKVGASTDGAKIAELVKKWLS